MELNRESTTCWSGAAVLNGSRDEWPSDVTTALGHASPPYSALKKAISRSLEYIVTRLMHIISAKS